jgi:hypothetical protein
MPQNTKALQRATQSFGRPDVLAGTTTIADRATFDRPHQEQRPHAPR